MAHFLKFFSQEQFLNKMQNSGGDGTGRPIPPNPNQVAEQLKNKYIGAKEAWNEANTSENGEAYKKAGEEYFKHVEANLPKLDGYQIPTPLDIAAEQGLFNGWKNAYDAAGAQQQQAQVQQPQTDIVYGALPATAQTQAQQYGDLSLTPAGPSTPQNAANNQVATPYSNMDEIPGFGGVGGIPTAPITAGYQSATANQYGRAAFADQSPSTGPAAKPVIYGTLPISRSLTEKENTEINEALDNARKPTKTAVTDENLNAGTNTLKESIAKLSEDEFKKLKIQNPALLKEAAEAALKGSKAVTTYLHTQTGKFNFINEINAAVDIGTKEKPNGLKQNQIKEVGDTYERFVKKGIEAKEVKTFVQEFQSLNKDSKGNTLQFPLNLITDNRNENMVRLCAKDPDTSAQALQAFKKFDEKGLNAFRTSDLAQVMECAMTASIKNPKNIDPKKHDQAVNNVINIIQDQAVGSGFYTYDRKLNINKDKLAAIKAGLNQDSLQEKPKKGLAQVFRDKTGLGGSAVAQPPEGEKLSDEDRKKKASINLHPGDNAKATLKTFTEVFSKNPFKMAGNLVKLAVYNIPKLVVSTLIATPIALVRTATQMSKDKKNLRLQNATMYANKYPKAFAAIRNAMIDEGKKVSNKNMIKAFSSLGDRNATMLENSKLEKNVITNELVKKVKADKGPSVITNLLRGGNALTTILDQHVVIQEKAAKAKLNKEYGSKVVAAVEGALTQTDTKISINKVLEGLGREAAKALDSSPLTQEKITERLLKPLNASQNSSSRIAALAGGGNVAKEVGSEFEKHARLKSDAGLGEGLKGNTQPGGSVTNNTMRSQSHAQKQHGSGMSI